MKDLVREGKLLISPMSQYCFCSLQLLCGTANSGKCRGKVGDRDSYCSLGRIIWTTSSPWSSKGESSYSGLQCYLWSRDCNTVAPDQMRVSQGSADKSRWRMLMLAALYSLGRKGTHRRFRFNLFLSSKKTATIYVKDCSVNHQN